jgi:hypothetical protein
VVLQPVLPRDDGLARARAAAQEPLLHLAVVVRAGVRLAVVARLEQQVVALLLHQHRHPELGVGVERRVARELLQHVRHVQRRADALARAVEVEQAVVLAAQAARGGPEDQLDQRQQDRHAGHRREQQLAPRRGQPVAHGAVVELDLHDGARPEPVEGGEHVALGGAHLLGHQLAPGRLPDRRPPGRRRLAPGRRGE